MRLNYYIEDYLDKEKDKLFIKYCKENNYEYLDQITEADFILFAIKYKLGRQKYKELQQYVDAIRKEAYSGNIPTAGVNIEPFEYKIRFDEKDSIDLMNLSNRSYNALQKNKINTILKLFVMSEKDLRQIRSMGSKSVNEVLRLRKDYFPASDIVYKVIDKMNIKEEIISLLINEKESNIGSKMEDNERMVIQYAREAINTIGFEIAKKAYDDPERMKMIINSFKNYSLVSQHTKEILKVFYRIPKKRFDKEIQNYIDVLNDEVKEEIYTPIKDEISGIRKISEIENLVESICINKVKREALNKLLKFLSADIHDECMMQVNSAFDELSTVKMREILYRRFCGETLQVISDSYNVTREWIRQLEFRAKETVSQNLCRLGFDVFRFIANDLGKEVYTREELDKYMYKSNVQDKDSSFLTYILIELHQNSSYMYEKNVDALFPAKFADDLYLAEKTIDELDKLIPKDKIEEIFNGLSQKVKINGDLFWIYFNNRYKLYGTIYCKGKLTLHIVYEYILKYYYPEGIRLYEDSELQKLRNKIHEVFGKIRLPKNNNAISARVMDISTLYDRGVHIHQSHVHISDENIRKICKYIDSNDKEIISYAELFNVFDEELKKDHIKNKFTLQGLVKPKLEEKYIMGKDYISKKEGWTIDREIEKYILSRKVVTKKDVFEEFIGMNEIIFATNIKKNGNIIAKDNGTYIHASTLKIRPEDYEIKDLLQELTKKTPVSSRKVLTMLSKTKEAFLKTNDINSYNELFDVLRYMFGNEFRFSRPFIGRIGTTDSSNLDVARSLLADYDIISIGEIAKLFKQHHIKYISLKNILLQLNDEFLQVDRDHMGRVFDDVISEVGIEIIRKDILNLIGEKGYISNRAVADYSNYPDIGYPWNPYLVRSIVEKYLIDDIGIVEVATAGLHMMNTIFVTKEYDGMSHADFVEFVVKRRHQETPFNSNEEIDEWIRQEKLDLKVRMNTAKILNKRV